MSFITTLQMFGNFCNIWKSIAPPPTNGSKYVNSFDSAHELIARPTVIKAALCHQPTSKKVLPLYSSVSFCSGQKESVPPSHFSSRQRQSTTEAHTERRKEGVRLYNDRRIRIP